VLNTDWVSAQQARAANIFINYLTSQSTQSEALMKFGFRPVDSSIRLEQAGSPFDRLAANGFRSDLNGLVDVEIPAGNIITILRDFWSRNVGR
jgi:hypothetical protein